MKTLIVEDDFTSRFILHKLLNQYGPCYIAVNGKEAIEVMREALDQNEPYDLVCMDIMMPEMDGQTALKQIRQMEEERGIISSNGVKIIMTTALDDIQNVKTAFNSLCDSYLVKPIDRAKLYEELQKHGLLGVRIH